MLTDSLQQRLAEMERENPSLKVHEKKLLELIFDQIKLFRRYLTRSVKEYTPEMRQRELWELQEPAKRYAELCHMCALMYR